MGSKMRGDLQEVMNRGVALSISELKRILKVRGHGGMKLSGLKTRRGYLLTVEEGEYFFDLVVEGEEKFMIKDIYSTS
ncbi:hypothetical protein [Propionigenium maris]|nr:hypothetical protein [Propionigenium maris]